MASTKCYYYLLIRFWLHLTLVYNTHYELRFVKYHLRTNLWSIHEKKNKKMDILDGEIKPPSVKVKLKSWLYS